MDGMGISTGWFEKIWSVIVEFLLFGAVALGFQSNNVAQPQVPG